MKPPRNTYQYMGRLQIRSLKLSLFAPSTRSAIDAARNVGRFEIIRGAANKLGEAYPAAHQEILRRGLME